MGLGTDFERVDEGAEGLDHGGSSRGPTGTAVPKRRFFTLRREPVMPLPGGGAAVASTGAPAAEPADDACRGGRRTTPAAAASPTRRTGSARRPTSATTMSRPWLE